MAPGREGYRSWRNVAAFPMPPHQRTAQALERMCILTPARQTSHGHFRCYCPKRDWAPPGGPAHLSKGRHHLPSHSTRNSSPRYPASPAQPVPFLLFPSARPLCLSHGSEPPPPTPPQTWAPLQALQGLPSPNQSGWQNKTARQRCPLGGGGHRDGPGKGMWELFEVMRMFCILIGG